MIARALITGATGLIGRRLAARLDAPHVTSRDAERARGALPGAVPFAWSDGDPLPAAALDGVDVVFHLAGEAIAAKRLTAEHKARVKESRVAGTRHLVDAIGASQTTPRVLVAASAVGWYGDGGDAEIDERSAPGHDFLAEVCAAWEKEAARAEDLGVRVVLARIGIVLDAAGGALGKMLGPFRLGVGGPLGSGEQWMPWIHIDDVVGLLLFAATEASLRGPMNATAPNPATNREFTRALGAALHRPAFIAVPGFALRAAFGELADGLLGSQRVIPRAALRAGYAFRYPELRGALEAAVRA